MDLDILAEHVSLENYRATLAHKVMEFVEHNLCVYLQYSQTCHSFNFNAHFEPLWHPRFGRIMCVVSNREIAAGEEVLANYNYSLAKSV